MPNTTMIVRPRPQPTDDASSNYDSESDKHNMILGSIVLVLALFSLIVAVVQLRQGNRRRTDDAGQTDDVEMNDLGS